MLKMCVGVRAAQAGLPVNDKHALECIPNILQDHAEACSGESAGTGLLRVAQKKNDKRVQKDVII